ncbi:DNA polymerase III subunit beta [Hyphomicrobium sp. CS1GBMeth3]|uniref:DNA polymerase III subunit beta n=1 Tax=Hyphomicrobium sp. CS1GBMeth3 TaxID=1892845 RepID=UPI0009304F36|nr:DNA polymerase III subunit beta [Hyphomicrobium sp. CS1GBMeth3]
MKFSVTVGEFARAMNLVSSVIEVRTTIPILSHALIKATPDSRVSITGTDLERECIADVPAEVDEIGSWALPAGILKSVVSALPKASTLTVSAIKDGRIQLSSSRSRFAMSMLPAEDFPEAKPQEGEPFKIDAKKFAAILSSTVGAASTEETRWHLCGVYLHIRDGALAAVATDYHRFALRSMDLPAGAEAMPGVIISTKSVTTIVSLLDAADGDVSLWITKSRLWLETAQIKFSTALINGQFPNYQNAIPQFNGASAVFSGTELCAAVDRAAATLPEAKVVSASISPKEDGLLIEVGPRGHETAIEHIDAEYHASGEATANAKYISAMTKVWGNAPIEIHIGGPGDAIVFTSKALPEQLYMIMPMRR